MDTTPYWIPTGRVPAFPKLDRNLTVDVVVIGGGITGITAAYLLKRDGLKVALLERGRFACVDTGHTTAHVTCVTDMRLRELVKSFGRNHAQAAWDAGRAAMHQIEEIAQREEIECELTAVPAYLHVPRSGAEDDEVERLREDAGLARELGFDAAFVDDVPLFDKPGVRFANQMKFHPRKYLAGLLETLPGKGTHAFQGTEVTEIAEQPLRVKADDYEIRCKHVVIATHVPLQGLAGTMSAALFQTKLALYSTYAVGAKIPPREVPEASYWDTGDPYNYLRVDKRRGFDYAILGGGDHKTGQTRDPQKHYARVEKALQKLIPKARIDYRWSGQVIETPDGLPYIGEMTEGQFIATGFAGNGMTFGTLGAMMACDSIARRRNPWQELFDVHRKKVRGSAWDYLKENKDYPYYFIKDRLTRPSASSLRSVKRGEGRVVELEGEKVAAYRDDKGKVTLRSAVCTHMGCIVRWNGAEKTWDCPCHGSRFHAAGQVLTGPAETPLPEAKTK